MYIRVQEDVFSHLVFFCVFIIDHPMIILKILKKAKGKISTGTISK